ncbi:MAG: hypothetical protein RQ731_04635 [Anaerosomatales bacterium]|nr:hypothetical protein [Anaerosomatales bacterium]MDT8434028.1 hypothetical protein [Anaerosomatales bacterium]
MHHSVDQHHVADPEARARFVARHVNRAGTVIDAPSGMRISTGVVEGDAARPAPRPSGGIVRP